jgi:hypothetical protein
VNTSQKLILGAATVVFAAGTVVAIVQPGDLGDDDVTSSAATTTTLSPTTTESPTTTLPLDGSTTTAPAVVTTIPGSGTSTTVASSTTVGGVTTTTVGSGLGAEGSGDVNPDDLVADTGMESMLPLGLALGALALAGRRLLRTNRPA